MPYAHALDALPWEDLPGGVRQKKVRDGQQTVRLVRFPAGFAGETPCTRGHMGYAIEGMVSWDVAGKTVKISQGDAITIPDGIPHRLFVGAAPVTLLLTESHK